MNVLTILSVLGLSVVIMCSGETFYIVPVNSTAGCDVKPCLTLDQLARVINTPNLTSLTLHFLPGNHILSQKLLHINNKEAVKIIGSSLDTTVWFQGTKLSISNVENLTIENIILASSSEKIVNVVIYSYSCSNFWLIRSTINSVNIELKIITSCIATTDQLFGSGNVSFHTEIFPCHLSITLCEFKYSRVLVFNLNVKVPHAIKTFINNTNFYQSRGFRMLGQFSFHTYLTNCTFKENNHKVFEIWERTGVINKNSALTNNKGIGYSQSKHFEVVNCNFSGNWRCDFVLWVSANQVLIKNSQFINNDCKNTLIIINPTFLTYTNDDSDLVHIKDCRFANNHAKSGGGIVIYVKKGHITNCEFTSNHADRFGGAVYSINKIIISDSKFTNNTANNGGAIYSFMSPILIVNCIFKNNYVTSSLSDKTGAAIFASLLLIEEQHSAVFVIRNTTFTENLGAETVTIVGSRAQINNITFLNNGQKPENSSKGCLYLSDTRLDITGPVTLSGNVGGGIYAFQSQIYINCTDQDKVVISNNTASLGGGIMLKNSVLVVKSPVIISQNKAQMFGGGIYAYLSFIVFRSVHKQDQPKSIQGIFFKNFAGQNGGGVCAIASSIKLRHYYVTISSNTALNGGGLYLQENSYIYILKMENNFRKEIHVGLKLDNNSALRGGGIFVADKSIAGDQGCQGQENPATNNTLSATRECFIQTIKSYRHASSSKLINTFIINNTAVYGSALYGGLLDRCTVSTQTEAYDEVSNGLQYFLKTVVISKGATITSDPVQVVVCGEHNSSIPNIKTTKGEPFKISIKAIDQVGNPINATIHSSVVTESRVGRLKEGQTEQTVSNQCTKLEYNVFSQDSSAQLELYADGPCTNLGISKQIFTITFLPCTCPIGLQPSQSQIECACVCNETLRQYQITNCSQQAGTIQLETNIWIRVANSTNGIRFIIHDCPFDYCVERPVNISLNSSQEIDRQCAFNRSGVLCGECQQGLSLVLGTSKCKECSHIYLLLLLPFALVGIALVAFILFFNITIATGTIHSLIFYSNLLTINYFSQPSVLTVFISWVNLDLGIEMCFYDGMSSQAKVLLQLVFPAYLFLLMFLIIILCRYSNFFATLLSKRNPVAALCTLIFLSYSKLLQFIIAALQSTALEFPDGSRQRVWLYDGNVQYFTPRHTPHFLAAAIIVTAGGLLTLQLFFAQWFPRCSKWKLMKWTRNTKYTAFMDVYHAPFTRKHRYWVGLLLLALILHNSITALATNFFLPVLSMGCIGASLLMFKLRKSRIYKSWINNQLENAFLLNLIFLAFGTLYAKGPKTRNAITILANLSMGISAALFLIIICYHSYKYVYLSSRLSRRVKMLFETRSKLTSERQDTAELVSDKGDILETHYTAMRLHQQREPDLDVLVPITTEDYRPTHPPRSTHSKVTYSVVETTT